MFGGETSGSGRALILALALSGCTTTVAIHGEYTRTSGFLGHQTKVKINAEGVELASKVASPIAELVKGSPEFWAFAADLLNRTQPRDMLLTPDSVRERALRDPAQAETALALHGLWLQQATKGGAR